MKKGFYVMAIILTFFLSSNSFADYVIQLKNGRTVETTEYWEEKGEVKFYWEGGIVSLPKKNIRSIVKVEEKIPKRTPNPQESTPAVQEVQEVSAETKETSSMEMEKTAGPAESSKEINVEAYKKKKAYYKEQFEQAYQRYLDATSRRDEIAKKKAWEEFNRFGGQVVSMETELRKKNNGQLPNWWKE